MGCRANLKVDIFCNVSREWVGRKGEPVEIVSHNKFGVFNLTVKNQSGMLLNIKESEIGNRRKQNARF